MFLAWQFVMNTHELRLADTCQYRLRIVDNKTESLARCKTLKANLRGRRMGRCPVQRGALKTWASLAQINSNELILFIGGMLPTRK